MEMARSLLKGMNIPGKLWGEAIRHSVYLLNRLPTKAMGDKTSFESWCGRKPNLGYLKVMYCSCQNNWPSFEKAARQEQTNGLSGS